MFLYCTGVVLLAWYRNNNNSIVTALQGLALARAEDTKYGRRLRVRASGNRLAYNNLEDKSECHVSHQRKKKQDVSGPSTATQPTLITPTSMWKPHKGIIRSTCNNCSTSIYEFICKPLARITQL
jgi:hypothetical protein